MLNWNLRNIQIFLIYSYWKNFEGPGNFFASGPRKVVRRRCHTKSQITAGTLSCNRNELPNKAPSFMNEWIDCPKRYEQILPFSLVVATATDADFFRILPLVACVVACASENFVETDNHSDSSPCAFMWIVYLRKNCAQQISIGYLCQTKAHQFNTTFTRSMRENRSFFSIALCFDAHKFDAFILHTATNSTQSVSKICLVTVRFSKSFRKLFNLLRAFFFFCSR